MISFFLHLLFFLSPFFTPLPSLVTPFPPGAKSQLGNSLLVPQSSNDSCLLEFSILKNTHCAFHIVIKAIFLPSIRALLSFYIFSLAFSLSSTKESTAPKNKCVKILKVFHFHLFRFRFPCLASWQFQDKLSLRSLENHRAGVLGWGSLFLLKPSGQNISAQHLSASCENNNSTQGTNTSHAVVPTDSDTYSSAASLGRFGGASLSPCCLAEEDSIRAVTESMVASC